jgi:hypothetical protein
MATPIMRSSFQSDLLPIINEWHGDDLKLQEDLVPKIMEIEKSDGAYEVDGVLIGMSSMQKKGEGQTLQFDTSRQFYTPRFTHDTWALGFKISAEMMMDGKAMKEARRFTKMLAKAEAETRNILAANVINNGAVSTVLQDGGDSVCLFSASHPQGQGPAQSNVIAVNAALSEASLEALNIQIKNALDLRGLKANLHSRKIVVNVALEPQLNRILNSNLRVGTTNNDLNYLKSSNTFPEGIIASPYISSTTQFTILTDVMAGLRFYERYSSGIETDNEFDTKNAAFSKMMRVSTGWVNYLGAFEAAGA